jgi:hypothetical protein
MAASTVRILWKGTILYCCELTLFISAKRPNLILYEMQDTLDVFDREGIDLYIVQFKQIYESGEIVLAEGVDPEKTVDTILKAMHKAYISNTCAVYKEEISNVRQHH